MKFLRSLICFALCMSGVFFNQFVRADMLVSDFSTDVPDDYSNAVLSLRFEQIRPVGTGAGDVVVQLHRLNGQWITDRGMTAAANYNERSRNEVRDAVVVQDGLSVTGRLTVVIGPDGARRGRAHFPTPSDEFMIDFSVVIDPARFAGWRPDDEAFMPFWRKDTPVYSGAEVRGTYSASASYAGAERLSREGDVSGALNHRPTPDKWGCHGYMRLEPLNPGIKAIASTAPSRTDAGYTAWLVRSFNEPQDWSTYNGIEIVTAVPDGSEALPIPLVVSVRAGDSWYECRPAAGAGPGRKAWYIDFDRFETGWRQPDWSDVRTLQIGVDVWRGGGVVSFELHAVRLIRDIERFTLAPRFEPVAAKIDPDLVLSFNGVDEIPKGLFGMHDVNGQHIEDRHGRDPVEYMREIRPGFLRPLTHVQFGQRSRGAERPVEEQEVSDLFIQRVAAGDALDNVMWCHTTDLWARPPWMEEGLEASAATVADFYARLAAQAWKPGAESNVLRRFEFWNEPFMWGRHINMGFRRDPAHRELNDPTQHGAYPGQLGADAWSTLFAAARESALAVNPHVELGGPSSPALWGEYYGVLTNYVAHILEKSGDKLDFFTEHHYGGDPRAAAASYEVLAAWCRLHIGRIIPIYNTEANAHLGGGAALRAAYNIGDIFACATFSPDKNPGRALHAMWSGFLNNHGEEHAYRWMAPLRGRRLLAESPDDDIMMLAVTPEEGYWYLAVFNLAHRPRVITAPWPEGFVVGEVEYIEAGVISAVTSLETDFDKGLTDEAVQVRRYQAEALVPREGQLALDLAGRTGIRVRFNKNGYVPNGKVRRTQVFSDLVCRTLSSGQVLTVNLLDDVSAPDEGWSAVYLRVVTSGVQSGVANIIVGDQNVLLPPSSGNDGESIVHDIRLPTPLTELPDRIEVNVLDAPMVLPFEVLKLSLIVEERT